MSARTPGMRTILMVGLLLGVSACAGVIDNCPDGLRPPPLGGWDRHGPVD